MSHTSGENEQIQLGLYCNICGYYQIVGPAKLRLAYEEICEHLKYFHKDTKINLQGNMVERLCDEIETRLLYDLNETEAFIEELDDYKEHS